MCALPSQPHFRALVSGEPYCVVAEDHKKACVRRPERLPEILTEIAMEVSEAAVSDVLVPLLLEHELRETPGGICEDGWF